jgi:hypothetical protein
MAIGRARWPLLQSFEGLHEDTLMPARAAGVLNGRARC